MKIQTPEIETSLCLLSATCSTQSVVLSIEKQTTFRLFICTTDEKIPIATDLGKIY